VAEDRLLRETPLEGYASSLALSPDGALLAHVGDTALLVRDAATGDVVREISLGPGGAGLRGFTGGSRFLLLTRESAEFHLWEVATGERRAHWTHGGTHRELSVLLHPDGRHFATLSTGDLLVWDILEGTGAPPGFPGAGGPESAWEALGGEDAGAAHRAVAACVARGDDAASFLRSRLRSISSPPEEEMDDAIAALEAGAFEDRAAARKRLQAWGIRAEARLRAVAAGQLEPESRIAIRALLQDLEGPDLGVSGDTIRRWRAIEALEWIGSGPAVEGLRWVAESSPSLRERRHASAALQRIRGLGRGGEEGRGD
jgi:hypothetical protein